MLPRDTLIDRVWGTDYVGDTKTLDVHVKRLRAKVEDDPAVPTRIVTIRGLGYKYDTPRAVGPPPSRGLRTRRADREAETCVTPRRAAPPSRGGLVPSQLMALDNGWQPLSKPPRREGASAFVVSPFTRLARTHAAAVAGDTLIALALANSLFFDIDPNAARSKVALYLALTMAPFAVVAPLIGPALDRMRGGRRLMVIGANALRALICVLMIRDLDSLALFPEAFVVLVLAKSYHVAKSRHRAHGRAVRRRAGRGQLAPVVPVRRGHVRGRDARAAWRSWSPAARGCWCWR